MGQLTRADLSWALKAVIPHAGTRPPSNTIGLGSDPDFPALGVWATDRYTIGSVAVDCEDQIPDLFLPVKEAVDLERLVRPNRKPEQDETVTLLAHEGELHVQVGDQDGVVYDTTPIGVPWQTIADRLYDLQCNGKPENNLLVFGPALLKRFAAAQRYESDRCRLCGVTQNDEHGAAYVQVGDSFRGAIGGMAYQASSQSKDDAA